MKKTILTMIFSILLIVLVTLDSNAAQTEGINIELNVQGKTTINKEDNTVEVIISLGDFVGLDENITLGYEATLQYDENMFEKITVEGLNGWTANYEDSTKTLIADVDKATPNTEITKLTFSLKDDLTPGMSGKINLNNILLTDGEDNDFTYNKEITVTVEDEEQESDEELNNNGNNQTDNQINNTTIKTNDIDKTTSTTKTLPAAGVRSVILIAILIVVISMIIFKFKSRKIKY